MTTKLSGLSGQTPPLSAGEDALLPLWTTGDVDKARRYTMKQLATGRFIVWSDRETKRVIAGAQVIPRVLAEELLDIDAETTLCAVLRSLPLSNRQRVTWRDWWRDIRRNQTT